MKVEPFGPLDPALYREIVRRALAEDLRWGDITTDAVLDADVRASGEIVAGAPCVLAGLEVAVEAFTQLDPHVEVSRPLQDGDSCRSGETVLRVSGFGAALLTAERTALNFLQRMSGTATVTRRFVDAAGGRTVVLDTRKTTPTLRALEKYAVRCGGGGTHRYGLYDAVLIKDNHIAIAGGLREAVERARANTGDLVKIQVEVDTLAQLEELLAVGADAVLLDNMNPDMLLQAVGLCEGKMLTEASGGITLDTIRDVADTGVDQISVGALTHSAASLDIGLDLTS